MSQPVDPASAIGKAPRAEAHFPIVVVGAGPAGLAAGLAAARMGLPTMLVDENPIEAAMMSLDVPLHFGQRNAPSSSKNRAIEQMLDANPGLAEAFELGIDLQLGVCAWGVYVNGESVHSLIRPLIGLADENRSWFVSFDRLIVAAGARDLGIAFAGWEKPGVMGAQAIQRLIQTYDAFSGRRILILGSGALGMRTAEVVLAAGLDVAGIVEVAETLQSPAGPALAGVPMFTGHTIARATGTAEVEGAVIVALDADQRPLADRATTIACDTIVLAVGSVPNIELFAAAGSRTEFTASLGGHVPVLQSDGSTSLPQIYAVGDCAGSHEGKLLDESIAAAEGEAAAFAAARSLGIAAAGPPERNPRSSMVDQYASWCRWIEAQSHLGTNDTVICQCEEVTRAEILETKPPRYLGWRSDQMNERNLETLTRDGPVNQDQVKRLTRAGMGPCQGRRCREQVQILLASATGLTPAEVPLASYRAPVRPLPLDVFVPDDESAAMRANWVAWFNIPSQWTPHWLPAEMPQDGVPRSIVSGE